MDLKTILEAARAMGPVLMALPAITEVFDNAISNLKTSDQEAARVALKALRDENDTLHARLQEKLTALSNGG